MAATLQQFESKELGVLMCLRGDSSSPSLQKRGEKAAATMYKFVIALAGSLAVSNWKCVAPPRLFVLLASPEVAVRTKGLGLLKQHFDSLEALDLWAHDDPEVKRWIISMEWPLLPWARENMSYLCGTESQEVYPWLPEEITGYGRSHNSTLLVEHLFNVGRRISKKDPRTEIQAKGLWHATALGDSCIEDFDRKNVPVTVVARNAAHGSIAKDMFVNTLGEATLEAEELKDLTKDSADTARRTTSMQGCSRWSLPVAVADGAPSPGLGSRCS